MTQRQNTNNPCPSNALADLNDNTIAIDEFVNSKSDYTTDRYGNQFKTKHKILNDLEKSISEIKNESFLPISGGTVNGSIDAKELTENGVRVYSPNNKPTADDIGTLPVAKTVVDDVPIYMVGSHLVCSDWIGNWGLFPFRANELPFGWYFRNGDNYLLDSPQGRALNSLSDNYKADHLITTKEIDGKQYINVPTAFYTDGRGFYERAVDGIKRQVGSVVGDEIRDIQGHFDTGVVSNHGRYASGAFFGGKAVNSSNGGGFLNNTTFGYDFRASNVVPTGPENKVLDIGMTPAIYLGV